MEAPTFAFALILLMLVYLMPTVIGALRRHPDLWIIFLTNLLLGWTLIFYVLSFALAISTTANPYRLERRPERPFRYAGTKQDPIFGDQPPKAASLNIPPPPVSPQPPDSPPPPKPQSLYGGRVWRRRRSGGREPREIR